MNAVATRTATGVENRVPGPRSCSGEDPLTTTDPKRERVDQDVAVVGTVKAGFASDRRNADAVPVVADAAHHPVDEVPHPRAALALDVAEAQRIEAGDRARAHGEDIAQDAADACGSALVGLDEARVVVALHLEGGHPAMTDVDDPSILARPVDDPAAPGREPAQVELRRLVRTVFRVEGRRDSQFGVGRDATEKIAEAAVLLRCQAVLGREPCIHQRLAGKGTRRRHNLYPPTAAVSAAKRPLPV